MYAPEDVADQTSGAVVCFAPQGSSLPRRMLGSRKAVRSLLRTTQPDLVASHFALYTAPALDLIGKRPYVVHFHGPWAAESAQEGGSPLSLACKRTLERVVYGKAQRYIVLSNAFADLLIRDYGVSAAKIRVVPGAVDTERFAPTFSREEARSRLGLPGDRRILLALRRLVSRMGLENLIDAMESVVKNAPEHLLLIAGSGRLRESLEAQVARLGLKEHVRFLGFVPDEQLPALYRAADLNVLPTLALEGFGLVAAEALAAGTPSAVTPVGGLPEVVSPLAPDLVFPSARPQDIAARLIDFRRGRSALPSSLECESFARQNYSLARMASQTADVYRELCR